MGPIPRNEQVGRIAALDGLRGIAILLVLVEHLNNFSGFPLPWLPWFGQHGVTIFFVLSGYLITSKLRDERERNGSVNLKAFYMRRFFRLMPPAWLYLFVTTVVWHLMYPSEALTALLFCRNFCHSATRVGMHFWTLSLEEQFYFVWPVILILAANRRARFIALTLAGSVAVRRFAHLDWILQRGVFFMLTPQLRADPLFLGCFAALLPQRWSVPVRLHRMLLIAALVEIGIYCVEFRFYCPFAESALIAFAIWSTANYTARFAFCDTVLNHPALVQIGMMSYSIYIWQQLAVASFPRPQALGLKVVAIALLSAVSYYVLERPMIRFGASLLSRRKPTLEAVSA